MNNSLNKMWNICRTCTTSRSEMISIFDQDKSPSIAAMISAISSLEILPNDRLPSEICITCFDTLEMTYYFKQQVTKCNDALQQQVQRSALLARCKMLSQPQANNEVAVKSQVEDFVSNEYMIVNSGDVATEKVADELSECHDPLMMDNDTYDPSKCDVSLNFELPLTNVTFDDLPEEIYIKGVNCHLEETEYKPETNEIDIHEHDVQFGDNCEITPREKISNNVADVDEFCSDDDLPLISVHESIRSCNVSQNVQGNTNENAEVTGGASEGELSDVRNATASQLKIHMKMHTGAATKPYKCDVCGKAFAKPSVLKVHLRRHTGERPFHCQQCNSKFHRKDNLKQHMRRHAGEAKPKQHKCDVCGDCFNLPGSLKVHMRGHTGEAKPKPHKCEVCGDSFIQPSHLKLHMRRHTGEKPFHCQQCNAQFYSKGTLNEHMRRHTGVKPFHCQLCNSKFYTKSILKGHMRRHIGEAKPKPHKCEVCGNCYDVPSSLKIHMRSHTGERPFHCQQCNSKFYSKCNLRQHMLRHTGEKPFHCQHCNSKFYFTRDLKKHMRTHTGEAKITLMHPAV